MWYTKNVPNWERWLRVVVGSAMLAYGLLKTFSMTHLLLASLIIASGGFTILTGFIGFCPMCALAGRRIVAATKKRTAADQRGGTNG